MSKRIAIIAVLILSVFLIGTLAACSKSKPSDARAIQASEIVKTDPLGINLNDYGEIVRTELRGDAKTPSALVEVKLKDDKSKEALEDIAQVKLFPYNGFNKLPDMGTSSIRQDLAECVINNVYEGMLEGSDGEPVDVYMIFAHDIHGNSHLFYLD